MDQIVSISKHNRQLIFTDIIPERSAVGLAPRKEIGRFLVIRELAFWEVFISRIGLLFLCGESEIIIRAVEIREVL